MTELCITTLAERPELIDRVYGIDNAWPGFMADEHVANALLHRVPRDFPQYCVIATDDDGDPVARGLCVPFRFGGPRRTELPDGGWDQALVWASNDYLAGAEVNTATALEIVIAPVHLGGGLSHRMLTAMRAAAAAQGIDALYAPVRPNEKHLLPNLPMDEYVKLTRPDGLPQDAWLRVHVRAGAVVVKVAPASMAISGSLAQWREWTGLPFDADGEVLVPGALAPVQCSLAQDSAVYVEANVWVRHDLR